jgi:hypothetical protein
MSSGCTASSVIGYPDKDSQIMLINGFAGDSGVLTVYDYLQTQFHHMN